VASLADDVLFGPSKSEVAGGYFLADGEAVFGAADMEKSGSDLTTLWTTPHPSGMSTTIQHTAITSGDDFISERTMVLFSLRAWVGDRVVTDCT
jgi:hypothetical protein